MSKQLETLREQIIKANNSYRTGQAIITDVEYDLLIDELKILNPDDELLDKIGEIVSESDPRKTKLPITMASMNKLKTIADIHKWIELKKISQATEFVLTPKYDGCSMCQNEYTGDAYTRGDGVNGRKSNEHMKLIDKKLNHDFISFGEILIPRSTFADKFAEDFENPRNMMAGLINKDDCSDSLKDVHYVRYGMSNSTFETKSEELEFLNTLQKNKVQYILCKISDMTEDYMKGLFAKWSKVYELDGIIIEVNSKALAKKLGRETSTNNPVYARAFKGDFEECKEARCTGITWNISKLGQFKPIIHIESTRLDGANVTNVTGNNARFVINLGVDNGALIKVKRSGMVIPLIVKVLEKVEVDLPNKCPHCKTKLTWKDNKIELMCKNEQCSGRRLKQLIGFFSTIEVEDVSTGIITQLFEHGYDTLAKILNLKESDINGLPGFGERKAEITVKNIHTKLKDIELSKLQHATGFFNPLGSKKLALLEHFTEKPSMAQICEIEGFSEISANAYLNGYDRFNDFIKGLPITVKKSIKVEATSSELTGKQFVFTGVRDKNAEMVIQERGGTIGSGVSKKTTHLVMKAKGSGSSKEQKAIDLGCKIITLDELNEMLQ